MTLRSFWKAIVGLTLLSGFTLAFGFTDFATLYWDNYKHFGQFWDILHSLNYFGEYPWWSPHVQNGWPSYYTSFLAMSWGQTPLFLILAALAWVLGRLQVHIGSFFAWYVLYFCFLQTLFFLAAVTALAVQIFRDRRSVYFALILSAFSPGVVANLSDISFLEPASVSLFFAAAWLAFLKDSGIAAFRKVTFTLAIIALYVNFPFLFWSAIALPCFVAIFLYFPKRNLGRASKLFRQIPRAEWAKGALLVGICLAPNFIVWSQEGELIRTSLASASYDYYNLSEGNAFEPLTASVPGLAFAWTRSKANGQYHWGTVVEGGSHTGYTYLGLLCLPLLLFALLQASFIKRIRLGAFLVVIFAVVGLSAHSPLFGLLIRLVTPLQRVNHYSDLIYRAGGYLILVFGAALGLDTLLRHPRKAAYLWRTYLVSMIFALALLVWAHGVDVPLMEVFGHYVMLGGLSGIVLYWMTRPLSSRHFTLALQGLLALTVVDTATQAYRHVRLTYYNGPKVYDMPNDNGIAIRGDSAGLYEYAQNLISNARWLSLKSIGVDFSKLPFTKLYGQASERPLSEVGNQAAAAASGTFSPIALDKQTAQLEVVKPFLNPANPVIVEGHTEVTAQTYNSLTLEVTASRTALLFVRDTYSPYWKAWVNHQPAIVFPAQHIFKGVQVPAGKSTVRFEFRPPWLLGTLVLAYLGLLASALSLARRAAGEENRASAQILDFPTTRKVSSPSLHPSRKPSKIKK